MSDIVIVGRSSDDYEIGRAVSSLLIDCGIEIQLAFAGICLSEEALNLIILNRADELVQLIGFGRCGRDSCYFMILCEENCQRETDISYACNCDFHNNLQI